MRRIAPLFTLILLVLIAGFGIGCGGPTELGFAPRVTRQAMPPGTILRGEASWYGPGFAGKTTANGETFDPQAMTAAHQTLAFNTWLRVTNPETGQSVNVRVNDHFPGTKGRAIDLSEGSFQRIAPLARGTVPVEIEVLPGPPNPNP